MGLFLKNFVGFGVLRNNVHCIWGLLQLSASLCSVLIYTIVASSGSMCMKLVPFFFIWSEYYEYKSFNLVCAWKV